jgi:hypothetical protein
MKIIKVGQQEKFAQQIINTNELEKWMRMNIEEGLNGKWNSWFVNTLYERILRKPEEKVQRVNALQAEKNIPGKSYNRFGIARDYYDDMIKRLKLFSGMDKYDWNDSDGSWLNIFVQSRPQHHDKEKYDTHKLYYTINATEFEDVYKFINAIPHLKKILKRATSNIEGKVSFKTLIDLEDFMNDNDNLCVHFSNPKAKDAVAGAVKAWMSTNQINSGERTHTFGRDSEGTSFGWLIAEKTVEDVKRMTDTGRYTLDQLVEYGVKVFNDRLKDVEAGAEIPQSEGFTQRETLDDSLSNFSWFKEDINRLIARYGSEESAAEGYLTEGYLTEGHLKRLMDNMYTSVMNIYDSGARQEFSALFQQVYSNIHYALSGGNSQDVKNHLQGLKDGFNKLCKKYKVLGVGYDTQYKDDPNYQEAKKYRVANMKTKLIKVASRDCIIH